MFKLIGALLRGAYRFLKAICVLVFGFIALFLLLATFNSSMQQKEVFTIADGTALDIPIEGFIVEEAQDINPLAFAGLSNDIALETVLLEVTQALKKAKDDDRIKGVVLKLDRMFGGSPAALAEIGTHLKALKEAGKSVHAYGDYYSQPQYYLASFADDIWLNPAGIVSLTGYGIYPLYFKEVLDKYGVTVNTFRVGEFKSFIEPYTRTNMSDQARKANQSFLGDLWTNYTAAVAQNLGPDADLTTYIDKPLDGLRAANGNSGQWALESGLVDELITRDDMRKKLRTIYGSSGGNYKSVNYRTYLRNVATSSASSSDAVAVLYAAGQILDGEQPAGRVGGDTLAKRVRQAASDRSVKAIVLRIDSPGGSAFASEIIRQELIAAKERGKKIVASFGGAAASGGYWIATPADKIMAHPSTITGSIGVFAVIPSFEKTLGDFGIQSDGVATTQLAGAISTTRGISDLGKDLLQVQVEQSYQQFLSLVASARNMSVEDVDRVAQGRVWSGAQARERGLVDDFGTLDDAIELAAELAGLEDYRKIVITDPPTPFEQFLERLQPYFGAQMYQSAQPAQWTPSVEQLMARAKDTVNALSRGGIYARCVECLSLSPATPY